MSHYILCDNCGEEVYECEGGTGDEDCQGDFDHYEGKLCDLCAEDALAGEEKA